jgi:hypothetical protein
VKVKELPEHEEVAVTPVFRELVFCGEIQLDGSL